MAAGKHHIIAFRIAPLRIGVKIEIALTHAVHLAHPRAGLAFIKPVAPGNARHAIRLIRVDEDRKHVFPISQNRRRAAADDDASALGRRVQNGLLLRVVDKLALGIKRAADTRAVRKHVAGKECAGTDGLFILPLNLAERNAALFRRLLEQQFIVTGHAQPLRQLFADLASAASVLSADANDHIVHIHFLLSKRKA